jgi:phosphoglycerate dehydrogenase-like enzyme
LISVQAIGIDSINLTSASRKGIAVCNVPNPVTADAVAEHALALLLSVAKRLEEGRRILCGGSWRTGIAHETIGLAGKTLGIVGFGRIGQRIASIAAGFKLRVVVCDIDPAKTLFPAEGVEFTEFSGVLEASDFVVLAVPATPETEGMINSSTLAKMKPSALLINVARGSLVVESELVEALRNKTIAGAGIDVFIDEPPPPEHPFFSLENVIVSPHVAGATDQAISYLLEKSIANVEAFVKGKPINVVNPEVLKIR